MAESSPARKAGIAGVIAQVIAGWAIFGGILLLLVAAMNVMSVIGGIVWVPFPGDFEMTQIGVAVAAFTFLPYCQLTGGNVTADIFTQNASRRTIAVFAVLASVVALIFSLLLLWRMYDGMLDQKEYDYSTAILQFPIWIAFLPILISLFLLAVAALVTLFEHAGTVIGGSARG